MCVYTYISTHYTAFSLFCQYNSFFIKDERNLLMGMTTMMAQKLSMTKKIIMFKSKRFYSKEKLTKRINREKIKRICKHTKRKKIQSNFSEKSRSYSCFP